MSPRGGYTPIDPISLQTEVSESEWHYYADPVFRNGLGNALKPSDVKAETYDCIYFAGGHGVIFDFLDNK